MIDRIKKTLRKAEDKKIGNEKKKPSKETSKESSKAADKTKKTSKPSKP